MRGPLPQTLFERQVDLTRFLLQRMHGIADHLIGHVQPHLPEHHLDVVDELIETLDDGDQIDPNLHLYVDADADPSTGRKGSERAASTGTEYMLSVVGGSGRATHYDRDGNLLTGPLVTFVVDGNSVLITSDIDLSRDERVPISSELLIGCAEGFDTRKVRTAEAEALHAALPPLEGLYGAAREAIEFAAAIRLSLHLLHAE